MHNFKSRIFFLALLFMVPNLLVLADDTPKHLTVGYKIAAPFIMEQEGGTPTGIAFELWQQMSAKLGYTQDLRKLPLVELLDGVSSGQIDLAVAAITVTPEREAVMDFTQPYFHTGLGIVVSGKDGNPWLSVLRSFFSFGFLKVVLSLAGLLLTVGIVMWLMERRQNPDQFGGPAHEGIRSGLWWSAVTMTTVGYGDKYPVTPGGRFVGMIWMFAGIILISSFTAAISSSLTVQQIDSRVRSVDDLQNAQIATVKGAAAESVLAKRHMRFRPVEDVEEGLAMLASGRIDAFIHDRPILEYQISRQHDENIKLLPDVFATQTYAFALPEGSAEFEAINRALLEVLQSPEWDEILYRYLGR